MPTNCMSVFDHFVKLALKGLNHWFKILCAFKLLTSTAAMDPRHEVAD